MFKNTTIHAIIDDKETYLKIIKKTIHIKNPKNTAIGTMPHNTPALVATPLPPLKFKKIEKEWPIIDKIPKKIPISSSAGVPLNGLSINRIGK